MRLVAELTMPNVRSWNGKWSGANDKYTKLFTTSRSPKMKEYIGGYYYNFGDGWGARVTIREAEPREKITNRFCGYEWMIESIKKHKKIIIDKD